MTTETNVTTEELIDDIGEIDEQIAKLNKAKFALVREVERTMEAREVKKVVGTEYEATFVPGKLSTYDEHMVPLLETDGLGQEVLEDMGAYTPETVTITGLEPWVYDRLRAYLRPIPHEVENVPAKWDRRHDKQIKSYGGKQAADILERASYRAPDTLKITKKGKQP